MAPPLWPELISSLHSHFRRTFAVSENKSEMSPTYPQEGSSFLLVVSDLTQKAPFLASWKSFKDHVRQIVANGQLGWVDVYMNQGESWGKMQGLASLRDRESVDAAFGMFFCLLRRGPQLTFLLRKVCHIWRDAGTCLGDLPSE